MKMRFHKVEDRRDKDGKDNLLFWPIGQQVLVGIARALLDARAPDPERLSPKNVAAALRGLGKLQWELYQPPWQYFFLVERLTRAGNRVWNMRSDQQKQAINCGVRILEWMLNVKPYESDDLKQAWQALLTPPQSQETADEVWQQVEERRSIVLR